ncbi:DBH-like monooxygenase protein 1 homolog [Glandiceps talaboti]
MSPMFTLITALLTTAFITDLSTSTPVPSLDDFTHNTVLDGNEAYHLYWKFDDKKIIFEVHVRTTGWVGLGFSPNGGMPGSDMIMGWVLDNGDVKFTDRHATRNAEPEIDEQNDYTLLLGKEEDDYTVLKFERQLDTCDDNNDWLISGDTVRVLWAYHSEDPGDGKPIPKHESRGVKSIRFLYIAADVNPDPEADVLTFDLLNDNYLIPEKDTTYMCLGFKLPDLDKKHHMIAFEPVIQQGNEAVVHHILGYRCRYPINETAFHNTRFECQPGGMYGCTSIVIGWAIGGGTFYFPEHAGFSLGMDGDPTFLLLAIHYDNQKGLTDMYDSSGIRIHYTPKLRQYDVGLLTVGQSVDNTHIIPPGASEFSTCGHCIGNITSEGFVDPITNELTNISVFGAMVHTHLLGKRLSVVQVGQDGKELATIFKDDYYDFNYQEINKLTDEIVLKPGDGLITTCVYDSSKRDKITYGGDGTQQEMCLAFLYVYPRVLMDMCLTWTIREEIARVIGIEEFQYNYVTLPAKWINMTLYEVLDTIEWNDQLIADFQFANEKGMQYSFAYGGALPNVWKKSLPHYPIEITDPLPPNVRDCEVELDVGAASTTMYHFTHVAITAVLVILNVSL